MNDPERAAIVIGVNGGGRFVCVATYNPNCSGVIEEKMKYA